MPTIVSTRRIGRHPGIAVSTVRRRGDKLLELLDRSQSELSVLLCDDDTIAELNKQYRGKDQPTDVLSFPLDGDPADGLEAAPESVSEGHETLLGDVVISLPTAARQAGSGSFRDEVTRLLVHGVLHLIGWNHETSTQLEAMERKTESLLQVLSRSR